MVGVKLPGEDQLPAGPRRALVLALHDLYQGAGRPSLRAISEGIAYSDQYADTVSYEAARAMLRGDGVPRWSKLECLVHLLAVKHHPRLNPEEEINRFLGLWNALSFPNVPLQPNRLGEAIAFDPQRADHPYGDVAQLSHGILPQPRNFTVPVIWGDIPLTNIKFTGREDLLTAIVNRSTGTADGMKSLALYGIFGTGKTQIAVAYAHRYRFNYQVVWWVAADSLPEIRSSLAVLAVRLGVVDPPRLGVVNPSLEDADNAARMALEALRKGEPFQDWLLIFDNASYSEDVLAYLPRGTGNTLITSRSPRWRELVDGIQVRPFTRPESVNFLTQASYGALRGEEAERLAGELGDLPLALAQAANVIATTGTSGEQYRQILFDQPLALLNENKPSAYPESMTSAWTAAIQAMDEIEPRARELLGVLSFFGPHPIPLEIIRKPPLIADRQDAALFAASLGEVFADPIIQGHAIRAITECGLAEVDSVNSTIRVHTLVQLLMRKAVEGDSNAENLQHCVHLLLARAALANPSDKNSWPRFALLAEHLGQCAIEKCPDTNVRDFALHIAEFLHLSGDNASSLAFTKSN